MRRPALHARLALLCALLIGPLSFGGEAAPEGGEPNGGLALSDSKALSPFLAPGVTAGQTWSADVKGITKPALKWAMPHKSPGSHGLAMPLVAPGGRFIYLQAGGRIYRADADTGKEAGFLDGDFRGSPCIQDGHLYCAGAKGLRSLDIAAGKEKWFFQSRGGFLGHAYIYFYPTAAGGQVLFGKGQASQDPDTALYALNTETGKANWSWDEKSLIFSAVAVSEKDRRAFVIVSKEAPPAADPNPPAEKPAADQSAAPASKPPVTYTLVALDLKTGEKKWSLPMDGRTSGPCCGEGVVFCADQTNIHALSAEDGKVLWKTERSAASRSGRKFFSETAALAGDVLLVARNAVEARNRKDGALLWEAKFSLVNFMAAARDVVYCGQYGTQGLAAFRLADGKELWQYQAPEGGINPRVNCRGLAIDNERLYFTTYQLKLYCLEQAKE